MTSRQKKHPHSKDQMAMSTLKRASATNTLEELLWGRLAEEHQAKQRRQTSIADKRKKEQDEAQAAYEIDKSFNDTAVWSQLLTPRGSRYQPAEVLVAEEEPQEEEYHYHHHTPSNKKHTSPRRAAKRMKAATKKAALKAAGEAEALKAVQEEEAEAELERQKEADLLNAPITIKLKQNPRMRRDGLGTNSRSYVEIMRELKTAALEAQRISLMDTGPTRRPSFSGSAAAVASRALLLPPKLSPLVINSAPIADVSSDSESDTDSTHSEISDKADAFSPVNWSRAAKVRTASRKASRSVDVVADLFKMSNELRVERESIMLRGSGRGAGQVVGLGGDHDITLRYNDELEENLQKKSDAAQAARRGAVLRLKRTAETYHVHTTDHVADFATFWASLLDENDKFHETVYERFASHGLATEDQPESIKKSDEEEKAVD
eukprot:CAMPEP_0173296556 /NCGR_PEP_ID=MMETSP1143-20121109/15023_1 /TAXON_ID=483371 /ORGANISM="non described non described, Strain CCMP2298" /LENGTH=434 /DNA_ID=CAMNT_0014236415 /DNA_START=31 /DNA_END=1332 /DNA_ORIENTATION=-